MEKDTDLETRVRQFTESPQLAKSIDSLRSREVTGIVMSGKMAAGKDSVGPALLKQLAKARYTTVSDTSLVIASYAAGVREEVSQVIATITAQKAKDQAVKTVAASQSIGYTEAQRVVDMLWDACQERPEAVNPYTRTDLSRSVLQLWGTDIRRSQNNDYWVTRALVTAFRQMATGKSVVLCDARFPNEINLARELGFLTVRLEVSRETQIKRLTARDGVPPTKASLEHASEVALDGFTDYDIIYDNNKDATVDVVAKEIVSQLPEELLVVKKTVKL